eukprot:TRINITY_DN276_c0_g1_i1.p1 TRINITY_DN276_c0_g1~~TRINITY_DN276_c0_g1_i1.p1  ORF type:complete len:396 (-),score=102.55 TRINITY_DN276_c0_g1_i1:92-1279(-)
MSSTGLVELLGSAERDYVIDNKGNQTKITDLSKNKAIGLYFSAHWCPPCRRFTPMLAECYREMKKGNKEVEIIFFSSDSNLEQFNEYFGEMPWLAVPFTDRETDKKASEKFNIEGIPSLIFVDGEGKTLTTEGRDMVVVAGADAYPFSPEKIAEIKKKEAEKRAEEERKEREIREAVEKLSPFQLISVDHFVNNKGEQTTVADVQKKEVVGFYFSAHWCGPCRNFTPSLAKVYNEIKEQGKSFEIVFVSSDRDDAAFKGYHNDMPWLALPFSDREGKKKLSTKYNVQGIPSLILVCGSSGEVISSNGRALVSSHGANGFPFTKARVDELNKVINEKMAALPKKVKDARHQHELELRESVYGGSYGCDGCGAGGSGWVYHCDECGFDLHTGCAKQE